MFVFHFQGTWRVTEIACFPSLFIVICFRVPGEQQEAACHPWRQEGNGEDPHGSHSLCPQHGHHLRWKVLGTCIMICRCAGCINRFGPVYWPQ